MYLAYRIRSKVPEQVPYFAVCRVWNATHGILRFWDSLATRLREIARGEPGTDVDFEPVTLIVRETILIDRTICGGFISLHYS